MKDSTALKRARQLISSGEEMYITSNQYRAHAKQDADILRKARKSIDSGTDTFICFAIDRASGDCRNWAVQQWVLSMMPNYTTVIGWLMVKTGRHYNDKEARLYRLAWLDHLIAICERDAE